MKINETGRIGAINSYKRTADSKQPHSANVKGKKDEVQISPEAKELLEVRNSDNVQAARAQKLEELKQSVSTGTYNVETGKIVEKLWPFVRD